MCCGFALRGFAAGCSTLRRGGIFDRNGFGVGAGSLTTDEDGICVRVDALVVFNHGVALSRALGNPTMTKRPANARAEVWCVFQDDTAAFAARLVVKNMGIVCVLLGHMDFRLAARVGEGRAGRLGDLRAMARLCMDGTLASHVM